MKIVRPIMMLALISGGVVAASKILGRTRSQHEVSEPPWPTQRLTATAPTAPVAAPTAPATAPTAPVIAPTAPADGPTAPGIAPTAPGTGPTAPVIAPTAPATAPTAPVIAPTAPAAGWVEPVDGVCPISHPIKGNDDSKIFHVPGGRSYDRTKAERCYASGDAALADGYRAAKS